MEYEFGFHIGEDNSGGRIIADTSIPNIIVGDHLDLDNNIARARPGINLEIVGVERYIFAPNDKLERIVTEEVYVQERDRRLYGILAGETRLPNIV